MLLHYYTESEQTAHQIAKLVTALNNELQSDDESGMYGYIDCDDFLLKVDECRSWWFFPIVFRPNLFFRGLTFVFFFKVNSLDFNYEISQRIKKLIQFFFSNWVNFIRSEKWHS